MSSIQLIEKLHRCKSTYHLLDLISSSSSSSLYLIPSLDLLKYVLSILVSSTDLSSASCTYSLNSSVFKEFIDTLASQLANEIFISPSNFTQLNLLFCLFVNMLTSTVDFENIEIYKKRGKHLSIVMILLAQSFNKYNSKLLYLLLTAVMASLYTFLFHLKEFVTENNQILFPFYYPNISSSALYLCEIIENIGNITVNNFTTSTLNETIINSTNNEDFNYIWLKAIKQEVEVCDEKNKETDSRNQLLRNELKKMEQEEQSLLELMDYATIWNETIEFMINNKSVLEHHISLICSYIYRINLSLLNK